MQDGRYYRLSNPFQEEYGAWLVVDADQSHALLSVVMLNIHGNMPVIYVKLEGLDGSRKYRDQDIGTIYDGDALMAYDLPISLKSGDYQAYQMRLEAVE